jgi:hypothetical protein
MKWFRANLGLGSRLGLVALAMQCVLSFGHFHGGIPQAASVGAKQSGLDAAQFAASHRGSFDRYSDASAADAVRAKTSSDQEPLGQLGDDCAICAVMALANAMVVGTAPELPGPLPAAFLPLTTDVAFADPNPACVAFQPRAPPIS